MQFHLKKFALLSNNATFNSCKLLYSTILNPTHKAIVKERLLALNEAIKSELIHGVNFSENDWKSFTDKLVNREIVVPGSHINANNASGVILRLCADFRLFDVGKVYFQLLKSKNEHNNIGILSRYLRLCAMNRAYALENKDEIIGIYKQIRQVSVMEPMVGERCIAAICLYESHWREAFDLFEDIKLTGCPSPLTHFSIAEACFRFGEVSRGWQILRSYCEKGDSRPNPDCYLAYMDWCERLKAENNLKIQDIEDIFRFLEEFHFNLPSQEVVNKLEELIFSLSDQKFQWSLKETYIPKSAVCSNCRKLLEPVVISSEEFKDLRQTFAKKAVIGKNVFLKSTPEEIESFRLFLQNARPYDIVIDGLNVAFARRQKDFLSQASTLKSVVEHFVKQNKQVMVLGRQHMKYWPKEHMDYIYKNTQVFLAKNLSQDDPLLLYAALKGGDKTTFLSRDLMRSHIFALEDPRIKLLFRKWLVSHQYMFGYFTKQGRPSILPPLPYQPTAQKLPLPNDQFCWHVPYDLEYVMIPPTNKAPPPRWLCVQRVPRKVRSR